MGLVASAMAFSWSKWNSDVESSTVVLLAAESLNDEALLEVKRVLVRWNIHGICSDRRWWQLHKQSKEKVWKDIFSEWINKWLCLPVSQLSYKLEIVQLWNLLNECFQIPLPPPISISDYICSEKFSAYFHGKIWLYSHAVFSVYSQDKKKSMSSKFQEDWSVYMATKRRFMKLKMNEFDEEFNEEMAEDIKVDRTWKTSNFGLKCFLILCNHIFQHLKY